MRLAAGTRLGPYEILAPAGAGGMGEVYRCRDTRLGRIVAIKVLPLELSTPYLRQRFEQEARAISNLSHPNICGLYDIGHQDGVDFLVLEYLEGETLESRLRRGPLPLEQVVRYAGEIADALNKAHRQGITHRDLKPGNIMLTKSGAKLLDFGLAKLRTQPTPVAAGLTEMTAENLRLTADGMLLGTFQYMAPEQLEGTETDARTDIFALGCVMYEMATGRPAFTGKTKASLIAAILVSEPPPVTSLQPLTPPALEHVVRTCLAKDPDERWQTAHDVKLQLKWVAEGGSRADIPASVVARHSRRERVAWTTAAVFLALLAALTLAYFRRPPAEERLLRSFILPPEKTKFVTTGLQSGPVAVSPDGQRLAFTAADSSGKHLLWVHPLDSLSAQPLAGTEGASFPFWSPDSRYLGFFAGEKLKKVDASGGPVQTLCNAPNGRGGSWNRDGIIVFTPTTHAPLSRISEAGGAATPATKLDESRSEGTHRWPYFLPDGRHFLYLARSTAASLGKQAIFAGGLDSPEKKLILSEDSNVAYSPSGYLLFWREGSLMAQRFDAKRLELTGGAFPVAEDVQYIWNRSEAIFSISQNGVLAYQGGDVGGMTRLLWHDRSGKQLGSVGDPDFLFGPRLSPDGQRLAVTVYARRNHTPDIWLYELSRGVRTRFTFGVAAAGCPVWSPDGSRIVFCSARKGQTDLYIRPSSGTSDEELLLGGNGDKFPRSWSSDGRFIAYEQGNPTSEIWVLPLFGDRKPFPFRQTQFDEGGPQFAPDGRWIAYHSNESGTYEVYIAPFPGPGGKFQISTGGGATPAWRRDGKELFFLTPDGELMAVEVKSKGSRLEMGAVRQLFQTHRVTVLGPQYDFPVKAERFIVASTGEGDSSPITLVVNWTAALHK